MHKIVIIDQRDDVSWFIHFDDLIHIYASHKTQQEVKEDDIYTLWDQTYRHHLTYAQEHDREILAYAQQHIPYSEIFTSIHIMPHSIIRYSWEAGLSFITHVG